ncbi:MAG TPA: hypothetical protein VMU05_17165 [Dongiaceae bacterium]|nr:hypothetical protein [Dongiaceae bacterium]
MNRTGVYTSIVFLAILCTPLFATAAETQNHPKAELFGGYQYSRIGGSGGVNADGWNAAITSDVTHWFGVTADFSGAYKSFGGINAKAYTYTVGPTLSARGARVTCFTHMLLGGFHASAGFQGLSGSINGFAMMVGGGVDVKVTTHIAIRVIQPDWILWRAQGLTEKKNARISTGIVFRL